MTSTVRATRRYSAAAVDAFLSTSRMVRGLGLGQLIAYRTLWQARLDRARDGTARHAVAVGAELAVDAEIKRAGGE